MLAAKLENEEYEWFTAALALLQALACVGIGLLAFAIGVVTWYISASTGTVVMMVAVASIPWMLQEFIKRVLYTRSRSSEAFANDFLCYGLQLLGVGLSIYYLAEERITTELVLMLFGVSSLIAAAYGMWQIGLVSMIRRSLSNLPDIGHVWREAWYFGRWLVAKDLVNWLGSHGHSWVIALLLGPEKVGLYRAVMHLTNLTNPLRQAARSYLPSRASLLFRRKGHAALSSWSKRIFFILLLPLAATFFVVAIFPEEILRFAYQEKYLGQGLEWVLVLGLLAHVIHFAQFPMDTAILAMNAPRIIFYIHIVPVILLATVGVFLIQAFGILGAPLSHIVIKSILLGLTYFFYSRLMREQYGT